MQTIVRTGVFYEGQYFYNASNHYAYHHERGARLSVAGLHSYIKKLVAEHEGTEENKVSITEAHYFRSRLPTSLAEKNDSKLASERGFEDILVSQGVTLHYQMQRQIEARAQSSALDVSLATEILDRALGGHFDVAVLILGGEQYLPVIRKLASIGVRTMVLGWCTSENEGHSGPPLSASSDLLQEATYPISMIEAIDEELEENEDSGQSLFVSKEEPEEEPEKPDFSHLELCQGELMTLKDGYGFIERDPNNVFFHASDLLDTEFASLSEGDLLNYRLDEGGGREGGDIAHEVQTADS